MGRDRSLLRPKASVFILGMLPSDYSGDGAELRRGPFEDLLSLQRNDARFKFVDILRVSKTEVSIFGSI